MRLAIVDGQRREANPGLNGHCPGCGGPVRAKCGEVLTWHWAHLTAECDPWSEPESQWHLNWKARFPEAYQEVVVGPHRADVKGPAAVLEVQKSQIAPEMIREREEFYGEMLWMLKGDDFAERLKIKYHGRGMYLFEWKNPRKTWATAERRLLIDIKGEVFEITRINAARTPWTGQGRFISGAELFEAVCGKGEELVAHQWYLENSILHKARRDKEDRFDAQVEARRLEAERLEAARKRWHEENSREKAQLAARMAEQREVQRQIDEDLTRRRAREAEEAAAARIAADLERQRLEEEARRKSAEEFEAYMRIRREAEARQERLRQAAEGARALLASVQWYALEQRRGQIYGDILQRRPYAIQDVGCWSTSDLQSLLVSLERRNITATLCSEVRQQYPSHLKRA